MPSEESLHLPQLTIRGFRGIDHLEIPRLGRVTLLAGKNSVGKTTVLDAVRVYAARGRYSALYEVLTDRQEVTEFTDEDGDSTVELDWMSLFHGRSPGGSARIIVGPEYVDQLELHLIDDPRGALHDLTVGKGLKVVFGNNEQIILDLPFKTRHRYSRGPRPGRDEPPPAMICEYLGPAVLSAHETSRLWDSVALTDEEIRVRDALDLVMGNDVVGVAVVGNGMSKAAKGVRRVIVRLKSQARPVPLKSLGDGPVRLFGVALALANSRGGFLLIDEAENGIHHTVQRNLWTMILRTAHENDIQVLATTHSWDCVRGFAEAAADFVPGEGVLARLDRDDSGLRAVVYSKEALETAAEQGIEVR